MEPRVLLAAPTLWTSHGPGAGGGLFRPVIAPNGQDLWMNSDMSGIYHSSNFGATWQLSNFHAGIGGVNGGRQSEVVFTSDPNTLYIANTSRGLVKSTDGGANWTKPAGWTAGTAYWMAADPASTSNILVSNGTNLYLSTNGGTSFSVAYSSSSLYVAGAFWDGNNVYVGTNKGLLTSTTGGASFTLSASPNGQPMLSFTGAKQNATTRLLAIFTSGSPAADTNPNDGGMTYTALWRLDVGGSWVDKSTTVGAGQQPNFISMARTNISVAYLGGGDPNGRPQVLKTTNGGDAWADVFFTRQFDVTPNVPNKNTYTAYEGQGGDFDWSWGGPSWGFSVSPTDPNRAIISDGFVHVTSDGGTTWHQAYVNPADENPAGAFTPQHKAYRGVGLENTSVHDIEWLSPTNIMASYTDITGWRSTDGGNAWAYPTWNGVADNTLYNTQLSADGTKLYASATNVHDMYQSTHLTDASCNPSWQNGRVIISSDQGATWSLIHSFGLPVTWIELDPNNANRMYAAVVDGVGGNGGIWVTSNLNLGASSTWTKLANPPRTQGHPYLIRVLNDGSLVATYSARRAGSPEAFTQSSGVFYSTDGGATWQDRTLIGTGAYASPDMSYYTKEVTIDPTDPTQNTWWAGVFSGWGGKGNETGDLYRSTNRGQTWTRMQLWRIASRPGGSGVSTGSITINPTTREMFVTTETSGVLYTPDVNKANLTYTDFTDLSAFPFWGPERVLLNPYNNTDVWVATFGGGIWQGGVGPSALTVTGTGPTWVNLAWADNSANEAGFQIDRATDANFTQNLVTTTAALNATSASITGLTSSTPYYFRVRAVNGANKSADSSTVTTTTTSQDATPPTLQAATSWKTHSTAGDFGLPLSLTGTTRATGATIEPRLNGPTKLVFNLSEAIVAADGTLSANEFALTNATFASASLAGTQLTLNLTNAVNRQYVTVQLQGLQDAAGNPLAGDNNVTIGALYGDIDQSGQVNLLDFQQVKTKLLQPLTTTNFLADLDGSGQINLLDFQVVKIALLNGLP